MKVGHIISILGALLFVAGSTVVPWQHFDLANLDATALQVHAAGLIFTVLAGLAALLSIGGLVTGRRAVTAEINLGIGFLLLLWVIISGAGKSWGYHLMQYEEVGMGLGYIFAIWGMVLVAGGALVVMASLPKWDETTSFLRVLVSGKGQLLQDIVVYAPRTVRVRDELVPAAQSALGDVAMRLPAFKVTREGDCSISLPDSNVRVTLNQREGSAGDLAAKSSGGRFAPLRRGDRGVLQYDNAAVAFEFVKPLPGRAPVPLIYWTEVTAFAMVAMLIIAGAGLYTILFWNEEAHRKWNQDDMRTADITAEMMEDEKPEEKVVEIVDAEIAEPEVSKKAGGEEGKFGDPEVSPQIESKIPKMDGKMVDHIDPKNIGLTEILNTANGPASAIAEVLNGDVASMSAKLAVAMGGEGSEFVIGHGSGGMGFQGDGSGGGGDGVGRIQGMGDIDTGGGNGVKAGLADKGKKRVGNMALGGQQSSGFCKKGNIESVVRRRAGAIRACYEQRLQVKKELQGKLTVRWTINVEGGVDAAASSSDTIGDGETTNCVLRHIRRMRFEKPEGGICVVQWPFVFSPG